MKAVFFAALKQPGSTGLSVQFADRFGQGGQWVEVCALVFQRMKDVTLILQAVGRGEKQATEELLPLVYNELRNLAAARNQPGRSWFRWAA